jgi:hypothetical protein
MTRDPRFQYKGPMAAKLSTGGGSRFERSETETTAAKLLTDGGS